MCQNGLAEHVHFLIIARGSTVTEEETGATGDEGTKGEGGKGLTFRVDNHI